jgi:hypothetical protein
MHGRDDKCIQNFGQKTLREETTQKKDNIRMDLTETG